MDASANEIAELKARVKQLTKELKTLAAKVRRQDERIDELRNENEQLHAQLAEAQRQAARQAAPFRRRKDKKIDDDQKKRPGRKVGHEGHCRKVPDQVDQDVEVPLDQCPKCGGDIDDVHPIEQFIEEIPPVRPYVVRVVTYTACCQRCGQVHSTYPLQTSRGRGAAKVQLGPRALATDGTFSPEELAVKRAGLQDWADRLLDQPRTQLGDVKVQNRLKKQRPHVLQCLYDLAAEPTNNRAERALRPAVIARKISCGNKTETGRATWEILTSIAQTCHQRGLDFLDYTAARLPLLTTPG